MQKTFCSIASKTAQAVGSPWAFLLALALVVGWAVSGPLFHYSDGWELVINTVTTIVTFLMVFLIQNAQNRDAKALHLKLDELIFAIKAANNDMLDIEELEIEKLEQIAKRYKQVKNTRSERAAGL